MMSKTPASDRRPLFAGKTPKVWPEPEPGETVKYSYVEKPEPKKGAGTLVGVRLQPKLLKKLDKHRGGQTRPQAIRELLEKHLP